MKKLLLALILLGSLGVAAAALRDEPAKPRIVHNVYFSLKENSKEAKAKFIAACKKYLEKDPGAVFFAVGGLAEELKRDLNDRDFDVALTLVFKDMAAHDKYAASEPHQAFIKECLPNVKKVRVFDSTAD